MEDQFIKEGEGQQSPISHEDALNASQREAVYFNDGYLLVIAGAGSGKTRTLTYRVARLVEDGVSPRAILLLTFTRKAAAEMVRRAVDLLDVRCQRVSGGTFHSLANMLLRRYASRIGFDNGFGILDRADAESLVGMLRKENADVSKFDSFPKKGTLVSIFSRAVNKVISVEDEIYQHYPHLESHMETMLAICETYKQRKIELQYLDYDDLLVWLKMLLAEHPDIRDKISSSYRYIMVDEYQDTNKIQADIIHRLSFCNRNVMAVGDDSQSIYAFRGANFKNIMTFPDIFPGTRIVRLEENYRSVQPILDLTNDLIDKAKEKYTKNLFTRRTGGSTPQLVEARSENDQSRFIIDTIMERYRDGIPFQEIAVLFRAGFHSFDLEIELNREGIGFIKYGGFKFMESAHIKDFLAHLRVLLNTNDRISWHRILLVLDKVGPQTADKIFRTIVEENAGTMGLVSVKPKAGWAKGFER
ncbi:MAG: UvrD-helicase domain-containing protein, partial [Desulfobacterales bacterium]